MQNDFDLGWHPEWDAGHHIGPFDCRCQCRYFDHWSSVGGLRGHDVSGRVAVRPVVPKQVKWKLPALLLGLVLRVWLLPTNLETAVNA
jgi:hypothetical protein